MRTTFLPYFRASIEESDVDAVSAVLRDGWLTSGPRVREFEAAFAARAGVEHAVALSSCTAALHLALAAIGVGPGDEVVMPSLTFVAGAQCTIELGARPVFADVDRRTLSITPDTISAALSARTKAIIAMPYAGRPLDIDAIVAVARERGIRVIEDAAHGTGMLDRGRWAGSASDAAAYSFYATKNITTSEGGMLVTRDAALAERVRMLSMHGMSKDAWKRYSASGSWRYDVLAPGYKYNLPDPLAALGIEQLKKLEVMQERRRELAARYLAGLATVDGIDVPDDPYDAGDRHAWCMFAVFVNEQAFGMHRDRVINELFTRRIGTSVHYIPTHLFQAYRDFTRAPLPNTETLADRLISLPLYPSMLDSDVDDVIEALSELAATRVYALNGPSPV